MTQKMGKEFLGPRSPWCWRWSVRAHPVALRSLTTLWTMNSEVFKSAYKSSCGVLGRGLCSASLSTRRRRVALSFGRRARFWGGSCSQGVVSLGTGAAHLPGVGDVTAALGLLPTGRRMGFPCGAPGISRRTRRTALSAGWRGAVIAISTIAKLYTTHSLYTFSHSGPPLVVPLLPRVWGGYSWHKSQCFHWCCQACCVLSGIPQSGRDIYVYPTKWPR